MDSYQADDIDQVGDLDDDFQTEFATPQHAGDFAILVVGATIDVVSDEYRAAVFQAPHRPDVG